VEIDLFKETSIGQRPEKLGNILRSSHLQHHDDTHSVAAFVRLRPSPQDSGCAIYSCRVSHVSLQGLYIHKSIIGPGEINQSIPMYKALYISAPVTK
jgi:hypothetical protein